MQVRPGECPEVIGTSDEPHPLVAAARTLVASTAMTTGSTATGLTSGSSELRRLNVAMLFAAIAAFGLLYSTQALLPSIGASFGVGPTAASLTVSAATGALALAILPL